MATTSQSDTNRQDGLPSSGLSSVIAGMCFCRHSRADHASDDIDITDILGHCLVAGCRCAQFVERPTTPQERNAAILLNHARIRPEFVQHNGRTIADLTRMVGRRLDQPRSLRLELSQDRHIELGVCCYEERFGENCSIQCQEPAVVHERLTEFETCLKHFGKVGL